MMRIFLLSLFISLSFLSYSQNQNVSELVFQSEGTPTITVETDLDYLLRFKMKELYQDARITITEESGNELLSLPARIRTRGNIRKEQCRYPPVKIDLSKKDLDSLGFVKGIDKLKMVWQCKSGDYQATKLFKEHLIYEMYKIIDDRGIKSKLAKVKVIHEDEVTELMGIFVEEEKAYAQRTNGIIVEAGKIRSESLKREFFLKMNFFQYMIANTDFSIYNFHNMEIVKYGDEKRPVAIPYDFDYSGFVDQSYAVPYETLPIQNIHDRYMHPFPIVEGEFDAVVKYYLSIEDEIYTTVAKAEYLTDKERERAKNYLEGFFKIMRKPNGLKRNMVKR